ncbi:hypothetical protein [Bradyrhizobium sp. F1.13.3]|uniref:hypothetical protein n=1 Tax=Bradyrhizobium sp. F1.13.3 TaxID=3156351 RepID=UPI0033914347
MAAARRQGSRRDLNLRAFNRQPCFVSAVAAGNPSFDQQPGVKGRIYSLHVPYKGVEYSFSDAHINDAIVSGIAAGLKLFVISPYALKALQNDHRNWQRQTRAHRV